MKKREQKDKRKEQEVEVDSWNAASPSPVKARKDLTGDFLAFQEVRDFTVQPQQKEEPLELKMAAKFNSRVKYPWLSKSTLKIKDIFLFLHSEILDFAEFVSPTPEDIKKREIVVDRVRAVLLRSYPDAKVCVFGSCATGLNLPSSDIDLLCYYPAVRE